MSEWLGPGLNAPRCESPPAKAILYPLAFTQSKNRKPYPDIVKLYSFSRTLNACTPSEVHQAKCKHHQA
jgi:hypothetical protein